MTNLHRAAISADKLIGELSSTLGASSLENFSTVSGCHSFSEAMLFASLSLLRLIRSLHDMHLLFVQINIDSRVFILTQGIL